MRLALGAALFADVTTHLVVPAGEYTNPIQLTVTDPVNGLSTTIAVPQDVTLTSVPIRLLVTPSMPSVPANGQVTLTAKVIDQFGRAFSSQPSLIDWTLSSDSTGSLVSTSDPLTEIYQPDPTSPNDPPPEDTFLAEVHASAADYATAYPSMTTSEVDVPIHLGIEPPPVVVLQVTTFPDTLMGSGGAGVIGGGAASAAGTASRPSDLIDRPAPVRAIITDPDGDTVDWSLTATPQGGTGGTQLLRGSGGVGALPGVLSQIGTLLPTQLPDGVYTLTLTATSRQDGVSVSAFATQIVQVRSAVKLGDLTLPVTDLTQSVPGGEPITVSRTYDSQRAGQKTDLGYGWTLDAGLPALTTTATEHFAGSGDSFAYSDMVYVTLPSGEEHVFAFEPIPNIPDNFRNQPVAGLIMGDVTFTPNFVVVDGSNATLTVPDGPDGTPVLWLTDDNAFYAETGSGQLGYNPALNDFGGEYVLTTDDGTQYHVDAASGKITSRTDLVGRTQTYSSEGLPAVPSGPYTTRTTNQYGISSVTVSPSGRTVAYTYDPDTNDLIGATVPGTDQSTTYVYADRLLVQADAPAGTLYAVIARDDGMVWRAGDSPGFDTAADAGDAAHIPLTRDVAEMNDGAGAPQWHLADMPTGIEPGTTLTITYFAPTGTGGAYVQVGSELRTYNGSQPHDLVGVIDGRGVKVLSAAYDPADNQLAQLSNVKGTTARTSNGYTNGAAQQTTTDPAGNDTVSQFDDHGNAVRTIQTVRDAEGTAVGYQVTVAEFQYGGYPGDQEHEVPVDNWGRPLINVLEWSAQSTPFFVPAAHSADRSLSIDQLKAAGYLKTDGYGNILWASKQTYYVEPSGYNPSTDVPARELEYDYRLQSDGTSYQVTHYEWYDHNGKPANVTTGFGHFNQDGSISIDSSSLAKSTYDPDTGLLKSSTDADGITTNYLYGGDQIPGTGGYYGPFDYYTYSYDYVAPQYAKAPKGALYGTYRQIDPVTSGPVYVTENVYYDGESTPVATATTPGAVPGMLESMTDFSADPGNTATAVTTDYKYFADGDVAQTYKDWTDAAGSHHVLQSSSTEDALGRVVSTTDANGNTTTTAYDADGKVTDTTDAYGGVTHNQYDLSGNLIRTVYPDGTETRSTYDGQGRVQWQTDRYYTGATATSDPNNTTTANATLTEYDTAGHTVGTRRATDVLITVVPDASAGVGGIDQATVASTGTQIPSTATYYNGLGQAVETVDAAGLRTGTIYYPSGQVRYSGVLNDAASDDPASAWWLNLPDDPTQDIMFKRANARGAFDAGDTVVQDTTGARASFVSDDPGNGAFHLAYLGGTWDATHAVSDTDTGATADADTGAGGTMTADLNGLFASYSSYQYARQQDGRWHLNVVSTFDETTDLLGHATRTYSDTQGRPVATLYTDNSYIQTAYSYYSSGINYAATTPDQWDGSRDGAWYLSAAANGWPDADGQRLPDGYREVATTAQRLSGSDDPVQATIDLYDPAGRLVDVWLPAVADADPDSATYGTSVRPHWHYAYDASGNETEQVDPKGDVTTWTYDEQGRQTSRTLPDGETEYSFYDDRTRQQLQDAGETLSASAGLGELAFSVDFDGHVTRYRYDNTPAGAGRSVSKDFYDALTGGYTASPSSTVSDLAAHLPASPGQSDSYTYDNLGRTHTTTDDSGTTTTNYDPVTGNISEIDSPEGTIQYAYDPATGNKVRMWTDHNDTAYEYDPQGRLTKVDVLELNDTRYATYTGVDPATHNPTFTDYGTAAAQTVAYTYDPAGDLRMDTEPNGMKTTYTYDRLNRLTFEEVQNPTGDDLATYTYTLRDDGLRSSVTEHQLGTDNTTFSDVKVSYTYDNDGRLTQEFRDAASGYDGGGQPIFSSTGAPDSPGDYADTFAFDLEGNRMTKTHTESDTAAAQTIAYTYNAADQLTEETATGANPYDTTYTYDDNGSETAATRTGTNPETDTYGWDLRNRMTASAETATASATGTTTATTGTFTYDDAGVRVAETSTVTTTPATGTATTTTLTTVYLNDPLNPTGYAKPVEEKASATAAPRTSKVLGLRVEGQALTPATGGPVVVYLLTDGHGSTRALVDTNGAIAERDDYDAFGTRLQIGSSLTTWLFGGDGAYDPATGWTYHLARWRNGFQFVSYDTFRGDPASPASLHKYHYADDNPINSVDPTGHWTYVEVLVVTGIIGLISAGQGLLAATTAVKFKHASFLDSFIRGSVSTFVTDSLTVFFDMDGVVSVPLGNLAGDLTADLVAGNYRKGQKAAVDAMITTIVDVATGIVAGALYDHFFPSAGNPDSSTVVTAFAASPVGKKVANALGELYTISATASVTDLICGGLDEVALSLSDGLFHTIKWMQEYVRQRDSAGSGI